ncbi:MAG: DUF924 domain-containing protein [Rhodobacteraceae bacterium]|nr:DUF924 domain-containing protein [Paracoccaceae bacterium]
MEKAQRVLEFWINEVGPPGWYQGSDALDQTIRDRFLLDWEMASRGELDSWKSYPDKSLALVILVDQFPRNMFRNDPRAFATDKRARCVASKALVAGFDKRTPEPQRQFYYLPLMHSECLTDQERCVRLIKTRMPDSDQGNLTHAKVHREIIRMFGRFPYRNEALGRKSTDAEKTFIDDGGYQKILNDIMAVA